MKKKIVALALVFVMLAVAVTSATLAYLTDNDSAVNTFTVGHVKIELIEQQRGENGLEPFEQSKKLLPIVGSAQGEKDEYGMPVASNYVDKMVTVKNTGTEDAFIRVYFAIPSALDDGYETFNAGKNVLHFNFGNKEVNGKWTTTEGTDWIWTHEGKWNYFETTIDGVAYNVYFADYNTKVAAGETTSQALSGVYLDKSVNFTTDEQGNLVCEAFNKGPITTDFDWKDGVKFPVFAVACQAEGFTSATEAMTEAYGAKFNPWGTTATNWQ